MPREMLPPPLPLLAMMPFPPLDDGFVVATSADEQERAGHVLKITMSSIGRFDRMTHLCKRLTIITDGPARMGTSRVVKGRILAVES